MGSSSSQDQDQQPSNLRNTRHAFHSTRKLYNSIAKRSKGNKVFLPRNVHVPYRQLVSDLPPSDSEETPVVYTSVEPGITWSDRTSKLRCLWCQNTFFRFTHSDQLILHLRTCHAMLDYKVQSQNSTLVVHVQLQRSSAPLTDAVFHKSTFEHMLINRRRMSRSAHSEKPSSASSQPPQKRRRRKRLVPSLTFDDPIVAVSSDEAVDESPPAKRQRADDDISSPEYSPTRGDANYRRYRRTRGKSNSNARRTASKRNTRTRSAFTSLETAADQGKLFHSVVHNKLDMQQFELEAGDSDNDDEVEKEWRFKMNCEIMSEYVDTIAVEKLFMMLWNQFVALEHKIDSDRAVADSCLLFVRNHGRTIRKMGFEATLLRHLNQLVRIGLLDAQCVHDVLRELPPRQRGTQARDEGTPKFRYAEYVVRQAELKQQREERLKAMEQVPGSSRSRHEL